MLGEGPSRCPRFSEFLVTGSRGPSEGFIELGEDRVRLSYTGGAGMKCGIGGSEVVLEALAPPCHLSLCEHRLAAWLPLLVCTALSRQGDWRPCAALTCVSRCSVFPGLGLGLLLPATRALQPLPRDAALQPAGRQLPA